jgi:hypothetical protein
MTKGSDHLGSWFLRLVCESSPLHRFEDQPDQLYISRDSVFPLFQIFRPYLTTELKFQEFFDMMQYCAEDLGTLNIQNETMDEFVPVCVVAEFCQWFVRGFITMMHEIGFTPALSQAMHNKG